MGGLLVLLAAHGACVPVGVFVAGPGLGPLVLHRALEAAGIAQHIAVVVKIVGCEILLVIALGAGEPVAALVTGQLVGIDVLMVQRGLDDIGAGGADLVGGVGGLRTGNMGGSIRLFPAVGALVPVAVLIADPVIGEVVGGGTGGAADIAVLVAAVVIGMYAGFAHCLGTGGTAAGAGVAHFTIGDAVGGLDGGTAVPGVVDGLFLAADRAGVSVLAVIHLAPGAVFVIAQGDGFRLGGAAVGAGAQQFAGGLAVGGLGGLAAVPVMGCGLGFTANSAGAAVGVAVGLGPCAVAVLAHHGDGGAAGGRGSAVRSALGRGAAGDAIAAERGAVLDAQGEGTHRSAGCGGAAVGNSKDPFTGCEVGNLCAADGAGAAHHFENGGVVAQHQAVDGDLAAARHRHREGDCVTAANGGRRGGNPEADRSGSVGRYDERADEADAQQERKEFFHFFLPLSSEVVETVAGTYRGYSSGKRVCQRR